MSAQKKTATAPKSTSQSAPKKTAAKKTTRRRTRTASFRAGQQRPTAQRYTEIQKALFDRGYLDEAPSGKWGPKSQDALKRFQEDENLRADGKLSALSLIALGLGPKRSGGASYAVPPDSANIQPDGPSLPDPDSFPTFQPRPPGPLPPPPAVEPEPVRMNLPWILPQMGYEIPAPPTAGKGAARAQPR